MANDINEDDFELFKFLFKGSLENPAKVTSVFQVKVPVLSRIRWSLSPEWPTAR